jgi:hypothetical protein
MTKREAAIVMAYTGICIGEFDEFHGYIEEILERPVMTHELAYKEIILEIREKSKQDFITIEVK